MSGFRQFNLRSAIVVLLAAGVGRADEIRKWTDAAGKSHFSITGSEAAGRVSDGAPVLRGRTPSEEETFSVRASLRRREIEKKLTAGSAALDRIRIEIESAGAKQFRAWVSTSARSPDAARATLEAQRDALLASSQFDQEKTETLKRLHRRERTTLKDLAEQWKSFAALESEVRTRYEAVPIWFRSRLDCGTCPSAAQVDEALHPKKAEPVAKDGTKPSSGAAPDGAVPEDADWSEEDEDGWR